MTFNINKIANHIASQPTQEGAFSVPEGQLIAHLQKFLSAKYAISIAYLSFADRIRGPWRDAIVEHWQEHSEDERKNAYSLAMKIVGIGGDPIITNIQVPISTSNISSMIHVLMSMELEAIAVGRELAELAGESTGLRVLAENIVELDTHHIDDLRRSSIQINT